MRIGVVGGGQLGRMMGLAGLALGMDFRFLDPSPFAPAASVGEHICGEYDSEDALDLFADDLDVITYEFENIPAATLTLLGEMALVRPGRKALEVSQDRLVEKAFLAEADVPTGEWRPIDSLGQLESALDDFGACIVKTRRFGYDGKGQRRVITANDCRTAWESLGTHPLIVEKLVPFDRELSLVGVRSTAGEVRSWALVENVHLDGILHKTTAPAQGVAAETQQRAEAMMLSVMEALDYVGVLTIELFEVEGGLLVNEIAPRVHNSGHWTIEGAVTSQFENHVRAIAGLPLGSTAVRFASTMVNCIGAMPPACEVLELPGVHLHDYGKTARAGRKVGHITLCDEPRDGRRDYSERIAAVEALISRAQPPVTHV